jgi:hypothetical protein
MMSCITSSVWRLGRLIIGGFLTLTVYLCHCIWTFCEAFILWHFCEGFGQPHDFIKRVIFFFSKIVFLSDNVEKWHRAGQATDGNMAHAHCLLATYGYKNTLRICNNYCFSTAEMVTERDKSYVLCTFANNTKQHYISMTGILCLLYVLTICFPHNNINTHIQYNR